MTKAQEQVAEVESTEPTPTKKWVVRYTGPTQHTRVLTQKDGAGIGVAFPEKTMTWENENRWTKVFDTLAPSAQSYFAGDPDFEVATEDFYGDEPEAPASDEPVAPA